MKNLQLDNFLPYRLVVAADLVSRSISRVYAQHNLTIPEWRVMAQLQQHESLTPGELGQLTNMEKARVSRALILMDKKQLIERTQDEFDKRVTHIVLNVAGRELFARVEPEVLAWNREFTEKLGEEVYQNMLDILKGIEAHCRAGCDASESNTTEK